MAGAFNNATYGTTFGVFSLNRAFTPVGSTTTLGVFSVPGTAGATPAELSGFGAVFTDVDLASTTQIEFFDMDENLIASRFVLPGTVPDASLSFLGVTFDAGEKFAFIRITTGTDPLAPGVNDDPAAGIDLVVMDDFLFAEPVAAVPEPASGALVGGTALVLMGIRRWRRRGPQRDENLPVRRHA